MTRRTMVVLAVALVPLVVLATSARILPTMEGAATTLRVWSAALDGRQSLADQRAPAVPDAPPGLPVSIFAGAEAAMDSLYAGGWRLQAVDTTDDGGVSATWSGLVDHAPARLRLGFAQGHVIQWVLVVAPESPAMADQLLGHWAAWYVARAGRPRAMRSPSADSLRALWAAPDSLAAVRRHGQWMMPDLDLLRSTAVRWQWWTPCNEIELGGDDPALLEVRAGMSFSASPELGNWACAWSAAAPAAGRDAAFFAPSGYRWREWRASEPPRPVGYGVPSRRWTVDRPTESLVVMDGYRFAR